MKTYLLAPIKSQTAALEALRSILPEQNATWLLKDKEGDVIAYFALTESEASVGEYNILADVSGRHYNSDADVISVLKEIQERVGGEITCHP